MEPEMSYPVWRVSSHTRMPGLDRWPRPPVSAFGTHGAVRGPQTRRVAHATGWGIDKPKGCWAVGRGTLIVPGPSRVGGGKAGNRVRHVPPQGRGGTS